MGNLKDLNIMGNQCCPASAADQNNAPIAKIA